MEQHAADDALLPGLYERVIDEASDRKLSALIDHGHQIERAAIDVAEAPDVLAGHVGQLLQGLLEDTDPSERIRRTNEVIATLNALWSGSDSGLIVDSDPMLLGVSRANTSLSRALPRRPEIPLSQSDILMNARGEPNLLNALISEIESADHIRIIVSFIKWSGLRLLLPSLKQAIGRQAKVQVLTTTYLGASDERAITALAESGAEVRVSFDNRSSRLHAKAWLFDRNSGAHTGYIGSSNVSHQAMSEGQEWNVRLSQHETPHLLTKFRNAFDAYWNEPSYGFERFDPSQFPGDVQRLAVALNAQRQTSPSEHDDLLPFEVRPYPFQQEMLDALERDRTIYNRTRNLIVAATGTGKTVVAALDYKRLWQQGKWSSAGKGLPRLLFVAHRKEILEQSRRVFRHVLRDMNFGELLVDGVAPAYGTHVFASVQSLTAGNRILAIDPEAFDVVIVDEFHHATAATWDSILRHLKPKTLLGLTATPERADGGVITGWFDHHICAELRLWDALERDLLVPFHYFAVGNDSLDFRNAGWSAGKYVASDLQDIYTRTDALMQWVVDQIHDKITKPKEMRALVFTSGVTHAERMAKFLIKSGLAAAVVTGATPKDERRDAVLRLRTGELQAIVTVDVFNEGVDIPEVDTVLMLRPTESLTVFLQQLGRGLRKADDKSVLTVLDFVGQHRKEFRFLSRLTAMTGVTRGGIERAIRDGFPYLPSGVIVKMDEIAADLVIRNIKDSLPGTTKAMANDVIAHSQSRMGYTLSEYLSDSNLELTDIYGSPDRSWSLLKQRAGLLDAKLHLDLARLKRVRAFAHVDDLGRLRAYRELLTNESLARGIDGADVLQQRWAFMLYHSIFNGIEHSSLAAGLLEIQQDRAFCSELCELLEFNEAHLPHVTFPEWVTRKDIPLALHARYSRAELLSAVGEGDWKKSPNQNREGVVHAKAIGADVFRMTWRKSERQYSPSTMYRDFAVSASEVHWQSQHQDRQSSPKIQRYVEHEARGHRILLFARESNSYEFGTRPFIYLGDARYRSHYGERPVSFVWSLASAMPTDFARNSLLAAG